jgi:hypothetical protein
VPAPDTNDRLLEIGTAGETDDPVRFMVISTQRSGSTWVIDSLNSHPDLTCYGALFLPRRTMPPAGARERARFTSYFEDQGGRRYQVPVLASRFLSDLYRPDGRSRAIGFKFMYSQFRRHPWVLAYARAKAVRVVHLIRRNKFEHVLSKESAAARGKFHALPGESLYTPPLCLDPNKLMKLIAREEWKVRSAQRVLSLFGLRTHELAYEDVAADPTAFSGTLRFLGVDPRTDLMRSDLQRWSRGTPEERIANYEDVREAFAGTRFSRFLP